MRWLAEPASKWCRSEPGFARGPDSTRRGGERLGAVVEGALPEQEFEVAAQVREGVETAAVEGAHHRLGTVVATDQVRRPAPGIVDPEHHHPGRIDAARDGAGQERHLRVVPGALAEQGGGGHDRTHREPGLAVGCTMPGIREGVAGSQHRAHRQRDRRIEGSDPACRIAGLLPCLPDVVLLV